MRALYQLWSLVILEPKARHQRLESFCLKDLTTVHDLTCYDEIMIYDKTVMAMQEARHAQPGSIFVEVSDVWWYRLRELLGCERGPPSSTGYRGKMAIWNNNVEDFKEYITKKWGPSLRDPDFSELWYDTPDEDLSD